MIRFDTIADLTNPRLLCKITGPIAKIDITLLTAIGFSNAALQRIEVFPETGVKRIFVLKQTDINADWLSRRTNDYIGREGAFLDEQALGKIWNYIHCPYVAFAQENSCTGLLMDDVSDYLFPDVRAPIGVADEDFIIDAIASLHASFWNAPEIKTISWLTRPGDYLNILSPGEHEQDKYCPLPDKLKGSVSEGWRIAMELLPASVKNYLSKPVEEIFGPWSDLPVTLLHGDLKIANMAIIPGSKLVLFDWPLIGCGPCSIELGWYLAVNSTRLARTKEAFVEKYRLCLESHLHFHIQEKTWDRMLHLAVITGAMILLWNKALGWQSNLQKGKEEWMWWKEQLEIAVRFN